MLIFLKKLAKIGGSSEPLEPPLVTARALSRFVCSTKIYGALIQCDQILRNTRRDEDSVSAVFPHNTRELLPAARLRLPRLRDMRYIYSVHLCLMLTPLCQQLTLVVASTSF